MNSIFLMSPEIKPLAMHEGMYGLAENVILLIGVSLMTKPNAHERVEKNVKSGASSKLFSERSLSENLGSRVVVQCA